MKFHTPIFHVLALFCALVSTQIVGAIPASAATTPGVNWTQQTAAVTNNWQGVTYGNGLFVAVSNNGDGNQVMTSPDGITWTSRVSPAGSVYWRSVTYGNGRFVAVGAGGTNRAMWSADGTTWTASSSGVLAEEWMSVTYGNSVFVAVSKQGKYMTSADGAAWISGSPPQANSWTGVTYAGGRFVAVAQSGTNRVMTSTNGTTWSNSNPLRQVRGPR